MKHTLFITLFALLSVGGFAQNALVGTGFSTGWGMTNCSSPNNNNFKYLAANVSTTYAVTTTANGTGDQFFRFGIDWSGTTAQRTITLGTDVTVSPNTVYNLNSTCTTSGAMKYNVPSTSYNYVFKTLNGGTNPTGTFIFFEVQGTVRSVSSVAQSPVSASVHANDVVTVTATLDGAFSTGQSAYLRYSTDDFGSSTVVAMTGSGTSYTATIPTQTAATVVRYYIFTSGATPAPVDADLYTINLNNGTGSNYSYTVLGALPVELKDFSATNRSSYTELNWSTSSERNNSHFEIERSADSRNWSNIGEVKGNDTEERVNNYTFRDERPLAGINYYRLKQVDFNGAYEYSKAVSVRFNDKSINISLSPNPVADVLSIQGINTENGIAEILDQSGKVLMTLQNTTSANVSALVPGTYILRYQTETGETSMSRFVKK